MLDTWPSCLSSLDCITPILFGKCTHYVTSHYAISLQRHFTSQPSPRFGRTISISHYEQRMPQTGAHISSTNLLLNLKIRQLSHTLYSTSEGTTHHGCRKRVSGLAEKTFCPPPPPERADRLKIGKTPSCRMTWALFEMANLYNEQIMTLQINTTHAKYSGPKPPSGSPGPGNLYRLLLLSPILSATRPLAKVTLPEKQCCAY